MQLQIIPCDVWNTNPDPGKSSTDTSTFDHVKQSDLCHASEFQWLQRASMTGGPWESVMQREHEVCGHCGPLEATNEIRIVGK